jgi:hydroxyquinol 1,2-dioxygenase
MRNVDQFTITDAVVDRLRDTPDPRLKEIMIALVRHLHDFAREVKLTEAEWFEGVQFLTATGKMCDEKRQEFILLSDVLGLSMLTVAQADDKPAGCTEATVLGPFFVERAPELERGDDMARGAPGRRCLVEGHVRDIDGRPIANAVLDVWQADADGFYDVQIPDISEARARARFRTEQDGSFAFYSVVPEAYPIPDDGPVGALLAATKRHPWRPAHLHFKVAAPGYATLITHVFKSGDPYLDSDVVFGVRKSLIGNWVEQPDGVDRLDFDLILDRAAG